MQDDFAAADSEDNQTDEEEDEDEDEVEPQEDEPSKREAEDDAYMRRLTREAAKLAVSSAARDVSPQTPALGCSSQQEKPRIMTLDREHDWTACMECLPDGQRAACCAPKIGLLSLTSVVQRGQPVQGQHHDDSFSDEEWTDDEEDSTPLDDVDPYIAFADALRSVQVRSLQALPRSAGPTCPTRAGPPIMAVRSMPCMSCPSTARSLVLCVVDVAVNDVWGGVIYCFWAGLDR